jgi:cysteine desulfurase
MRQSEEKRRYFDWAATAIPCHAGESALSFGNSFGNPSSLHLEGRRARESLESSRSRCAAVLGVPAGAVYFTSGGTESNAIVLYSRLLQKGNARILYSAAEHPSIRENCRILEGLGKPVSSVPVDTDGRVNPEDLSRVLEKNPDARFAALMAVNNETGAVTDMAAVSGVLRKREGPSVHFHCDITQALGKIPVDLREWDVDSAAFSAHKLGGPRGIGILYLRKPLPALYGGGGQEGGLRPGTENTEGALALADVLERRASPETVKAEYEKADRRWNALITALLSMDRCSLIPASRQKGSGGLFSPYIVQAAFSGVPGEVMTRALDDLGFAVSTGSACSSSSPSRPVLAAMGIDKRIMLEGIRFSQGWSTSDEDIARLTEAIQEILRFL